MYRQTCAKVEKRERKRRRIKQWQKGMWFLKGRQCGERLGKISKTLRYTHTQEHEEIKNGERKC